MKFLGTLLLIPLLGLPAQEGTGFSGPTEGADPIPHDLHATYGNLGVDGSLAVLQVRIFRDDLETALAGFHGLDEFSLEVTPEVDALFLQYIAERFVLVANGHPLRGQIIGSGDDELDREPVWWYQIRFDAQEVIRRARITNTVLFEVFGDQSNVLRVVKFPEERRSAYYFAPGEETIEITF